MKEPVLLGIDVGTTFCKASIVSAAGAELSHGRQRTPWQPVPTGAEIAADALLGAVAAAARAAIDQRPSGSIVGVGVTSMAEVGFLLDTAGRPSSWRSPGTRVGRRPIEYVQKHRTGS